MGKVERELEEIEKGAKRILNLVKNYEGGIFRYGEMVCGISSSLEMMRENFMDLINK